MGIDPLRTLGALRLTLGKSLTSEQIDTAATAIIESWRNNTPTSQPAPE
ncbi:hypothetical protein [Tessaracoccus antarcticus]|nr:hypothetical protein [Tessaracoccus antarcticus]